MASTPYSGGRLMEIFEVNSGGTAEESTTPLLTLKDYVGSSLTGHTLSENLVIDLDGRFDNEDFQDFLALGYLTATTASDATTITWEDGQDETLSAATSSAKKFICVYYHGEHDSQRRVTTFLAVLTGNTGNVSYAPSALATSPFQVTAVEAEANLVVSAGVYQTTDAVTKVTHSAAVTVADTTFGDETFMTAAT